MTGRSICTAHTGENRQHWPTRLCRVCRAGLHWDGECKRWAGPLRKHSEQHTFNVDADGDVDMSDVQQCKHCQNYEGKSQARLGTR